MKIKALGLDAVVDQTGYSPETLRFLLESGISYAQSAALSDSGMNLDELRAMIEAGSTVQDAVDSLTTEEMQEDTQPSHELAAELDRLKAENAALKAKANAPRKLWWKISEKKALSIYGLNARFPITLYVDQFDRMVSHLDEIQAFVAEHRAEFAVKATK